MLAFIPFAAEGLAGAAESLVVPITGLGALGYALFRISRQDANWDGLIAGLKDENKRKDATIAEQAALIEKQSDRLAELKSWEYQRSSAIESLETERAARKRALERLSAKRIELARLEGALQAAGIDPREVKLASAGAPLPKDEDEGPSRGILVLDDDPMARQMIVDLVGIRRPDWSVWGVGTVAEARDHDMHGVDLVVVDWNLGWGDLPMDYLHWLKENHPTRGVVILTGAPEDEVSRTLDAEGFAIPVLSKPEQAMTHLRDILSAAEDTAI